MDHKHFKSEIHKLIEQRNGYLLITLATIGLLIILSATLFCVIGHERIIVVPPSGDNSYWVSDTSASSEYITEMSNYFAYLRLNMTAHTATLQRDTLLKHTDPEFYDTFKSQLLKEFEHISEQHISMTYFPVSVASDPKKMTATITGDLKCQVGEAQLPLQRVQYKIGYRFNNGRLYLKSFEEVKHA